ncbi:hypothetical protein GCM10025868_19330 [Angustibacter aerolatus]|uniref:Uncharacterized protein n=1 Tax=Angustibacter aerolatus TaxID=1162965 RepID=A0ABQ6JET9_9ACTN|nr:hypothetical protein GCM10025868_19330 [Angustibacter aerolatus]
MQIEATRAPAAVAVRRASSTAGGTSSRAAPPVTMTVSASATASSPSRTTTSKAPSEGRIPGSAVQTRMSYAGRPSISTARKIRLRDGEVERDDRRDGDDDDAVHGLNLR